MATTSVSIRPAQRPCPTSSGVEIDAGAANNLIGTNGDGINDAAEQNLISGNLFAGVWINGSGTDANVVAGNLIGTDISGMVAINNGTQPVYDSSINASLRLADGVVIEVKNGASNNLVASTGGASSRRRRRAEHHRGER